MLATPDVRSLKPEQLDALREVANIGAGHAATALSTMTGQAIMINVPTKCRGMSSITRKTPSPSSCCRCWAT